MSASPSPRAAPLALWRAAGAFLTLMFNLFGGPEDVAAQHIFTAKPRALLVSWLRVGEAMVRRLLLIEAAACAKPNAQPTPRAPRKRVGHLMGFEADQPEKWRVSFRCLVSSPACGGGDREAIGGGKRRCPLSLASLDSSPVNGRGKTPRSFSSAWPLAERYEALLRAFNDPAPRARRLARRLHGAPARAQAMLAFPADARALYGGDAFDALDAAAGNCPRAFNTS